MDEYPKWIYRGGGDSKVVPDSFAHEAAGPWWFESPLDADAAISVACAEALTNGTDANSPSPQAAVQPAQEDAIQPSARKRRKTVAA